MMRMADGYGKCIGSIFRQWLGGMQQHANHMLNLLLVCPPIANHGLFYLCGRIGAHSKVTIATGGNQRAACLAELECGSCIFGNKNIFNGCRFRFEFADDGFQAVKEYVQAAVKITFAATDDTMVNMAQMIAMYVNDAYAGFQ
jgi:hypothetical protein